MNQDHSFMRAPKYYIYAGTILGPFSVEDLKRMNISKRTLILKKGDKEWKLAGILKELKAVFS